MRPLVIAHRGASGYRPEHTLAAYELALGMGSDGLEVDLVSSKDGTLIARHENEISATTDVARHPEFAARRTTKIIDDRTATGWFAEDFTLAELKTLRARERLPDLRPQNRSYDDRFEIPTLQEIIELVGRVNQTSSSEPVRGTGLFLETKHSTYFREIGLSIEAELVRILANDGLLGGGSGVWVESFETGNLQELAGTTGLPLIQLLDAGGQPYDLAARGNGRTYVELCSSTGLEHIATYAAAIGVNKDLVVPRDAANHLMRAGSLVQRAESAGLSVYAWTFRDENFFLPEELRQGRRDDSGYLGQHGDAEAEYQMFFEAGLDGVFSDYPDTALRARESSG